MNYSHMLQQKRSRALCDTTRCVVLWLVEQVNPFSIHAGVTKYSDAGVTPPTVADIANGGAEVVTDTANDVNDNTTTSSPQRQEEVLKKA